MSTTETPTAATTPPANWYPDPAGRHPLRWWDGARWTDRVSDADPAGPLPAPPTLDSAPASAEPAGAESSGAVMPAADPRVPDAAEIARRQAEAERLAAAQAAEQAGEQATEGTTEPVETLDPSAERVEEEHEGRPRNPLAGFDQLNTRTSRRLAPEARPSTGAGLDAPVDRRRGLIMAGVGLVIVMLAGWGLANLQSAEKWRDRSQDAEEELADRVSNYAALEDSLGQAASRGARLADGQQQMAELREATTMTVDQIRSCAGALNAVLGLAGTPDQQGAIDRANRTCQIAVTNAEAIAAILDAMGEG